MQYKDVHHSGCNCKESLLYLLLVQFIQSSLITITSHVLNAIFYIVYNLIKQQYISYQQLLPPVSCLTTCFISKKKKTLSNRPNQMNNLIVTPGVNCMHFLLGYTYACLYIFLTNKIKIR